MTDFTRPTTLPDGPDCFNGVLRPGDTTDDVRPTRRRGPQQFYAVRVTVATTGDTYTRDYVRGGKRMGRDAFDMWAVGDLLGLVGLVQDGSEGTPDEYREQVRYIAVTELNFQQVADNRRYHHTTH